MRSLLSLLAECGNISIDTPPDATTGSAQEKLKRDALTLFHGAQTPPATSVGRQLAPGQMIAGALHQPIDK
jgi:hypothetical protein